MKSEEFAIAIDKRKKREVWTWRMLLCAAFFTLHSSLFISCSEENTVEDEFANWQERNEETIDRWAVQAGNGTYRKILTYAKSESTSGLKNSDYIYVEVLESGKGMESPIFSDNVRVSYRGRLIPSTNYSEGYVFDQTYLGDFDWKTAGMTEMMLSGSIEGFATALMNMHEGDRWRVHVPYQLGYGTTANSSIPAYSNLIFEVALQSFWPQDEEGEKFKSR
jgi:FKBP-type peptidyl-prolyl cis-trans isomerase FklB